MSDKGAASPPAKRVFKGKSKGGCLTCRQRRVKCDEGKPHCMRCVRGGFTCKGYALDINASGPLLLARAIDSSRAVAVSDRSGVPSQRRIVPTLASLSAELARTGPSPLSFSFLQPNCAPGLASISDRDYQYYRLFCEKIANQLSVYINRELWTSLILRACLEHEPLRNVVIAIGAEWVNLDSYKIRGDAAEAARHHEFALNRYARAISSIRTAVAHGRQDFRTTLLTCLLIFCFESLNGDFLQAVNQIRHGLQLLKDWSAAHHQGRTVGQIAAAPGADWSLAARKKRKYDIGLRSPAPLEVEDILVQSFARLDIQLQFFGQASDAFHHLEASKIGAESINVMPEIFLTLDEAASYGVLIVRRHINFIFACTAQDAGLAFAAEVGVAPQYGDDWKQDQRIRDYVQRTVQEYSDHSDIWEAAFERPWKQAVLDGEPMRIAQALLLRMASRTARLSLGAFICSDDQMGFDAMLPEFKEVIACGAVLLGQSRELLGYPMPQIDSPQFTSDVGMISPLYMAAALCRHSETRREAVKLLLRQPSWREGIWEAAMGGTVANMLVEIEEESMVDGIVPAEGRVRGSKIVMYQDRDVAQVTVFMLDGFLEEHVYWGRGLAEKGAIEQAARPKVPYLSRLKPYPGGKMTKPLMPLASVTGPHPGAL